MGTQNRRQAVRVECDLPVRLHGGKGDYTGHLVDLSRTGVRVRLPGASIGVHRLSSLVQVTQALHDAVGDSFQGDLHHEMLGPLVQRELTPCRIAKRDWEHTDVEVGCEFDRALTDEEVGMLGVALPRLGADETADAPAVAAPTKRDRAAPARPHLREPEPTSYMAYLYPAPGKTSKPLITRTRSLTRGMALLSVDEGQGWELPELAVSDLVMALDAAYGTSILLRVMDGEDDLWVGPAELQEVDVTPGSSQIKLGVSFGRELRTEELGRLGLPTPA